MKFWFGKSHAEEPKTTEETSPAAAASNTPDEGLVEAEVEPTGIPAATSEGNKESVPSKDSAPAPAAEKAPESSAPVKETVAETPPPPPPPAPAPTPAPAQNQPNPRELYYKLMNALYDAVLVLDTSGHITDSSERVTPVLGYERGDMWDMPIGTVVKGISPVVFKQMQEALRNNQQVLISARATRKDGSTFQCEVSACIMRLKRGENFVLTVRNIEKRIAEVKEHLMANLAAKKASAPEAGAAPARRVVLKAVKREAS